MQVKPLFAAVVVSLMLGVAALSAADTYQIDSVHSSFIFKIKHMNTSNTYGRINQSSGTLVFDEADPSKSSIELELKADSVDTANEKRDQHLKGPDFFNAKQFPTITFKSKSVKKSGDKDYEITGDFTLLGVTKEVSAKFTHVGSGKSPMGQVIGFEGTFSIKRSDYGMNKMLPGAGDEVGLIVSIEAGKK